MNKRQEEFLDHFARLGVFSKVQALMGPNGENNENEVIKSQDEPTSSKACKESTTGESQEDAKEILPGKGIDNIEILTKFDYKTIRSLFIYTIIYVLL